MLKKEIQKLAEMVKDIKVAMFTTVDSLGELRSRPMITTDIKEDDFVYFFTSVPTPKSEELRENNKVNVVYQDKEENIFVSVSGHAELVKDKNLTETLWKPVLKVYFPKGKDEPTLQLVRVKITHAEFYNINGNKMEQLISV